MEMTIALAGNPNSGKTTLFNALTGSNQYVGNWPGVTVERKEARFSINDDAALLVDLPGIYSLSPYSIEERVTRRFLMREQPDVILNIVDATNLERNLFLTYQLMELGRPVVIALNLMDEVRRRGGQIACDKLSKALGAPIVPISAKRREGFDELFAEIYHQAHWPTRPDPLRQYDGNTRKAVEDISRIVRNAEQNTLGLAVKLLEGDDEFEQALDLSQKACVRNVTSDYVKKGQSLHAGIDAPTLLAKARYSAIEKALWQSGVMCKGETYGALSERIDRVLTNRYLAFPAFFAAMGLMLGVAFGPPGTFLARGMELLVGAGREGTKACLHALASPIWVQSMILDGVIPGVGSVLTFLPQILLIFLFLSILEESGYMARAAFITDRLLRTLGMSGRSFIPLLIGFGCTTTAVVAARGVENERERQMTVLLSPFMSCGAKLPVYGLFCAAFFPRQQAWVVFGLYLLGMLILAARGLALRRGAFREGETPFLMELPVYRIPTLRNVFRRLGERAGDFLLRAGTIIFAMSVLVWFLQSFSFSLRLVEDSRNSMFGILGEGLAKLFVPLGFGEWEKSVSLLSGLVAKEAVVSTMQVLYGTGDGAALTDAIRAHFTPRSASAFLVFTLLYTPCISALAAMRRELGGARKLLRAAGAQLFIAYAASWCVYQLAGWLGHA